MARGKMTPAMTRAARTMIFFMAYSELKFIEKGPSGPKPAGPAFLHCQVNVQPLTERRPRKSVAHNQTV